MPQYKVLGVYNFVFYPNQRSNNILESHGHYKTYGPCGPLRHIGILGTHGPCGSCVFLVSGVIPIDFFWIKAALLLFFNSYLKTTHHKGIGWPENLEMRF